MTVDTGQQDTQTGAGDPAANGSTPPEPPASDTPPAGDAEQDDDADDQGDDDQRDHGGRPNREARFRRERNEARQERDQLRAQLDTLHRQIIGNITSVHGLPEVDLLEAAGHELASFIADDGKVNVPAVIEATRATITRYGIRPRPKPPAPNAQQGSHGTPAGRSGLSTVIDKALGRDG